MLGVAGAKLLWYLSRGAGTVSLLLLTLSVVLGVLSTVRWATPRWPRFVTGALHRNASLLAVVMLGVHIVATVADGFAPIGWLDVVVPFASPYRPVWLGLGAVAFDLVPALVVTSLLRDRLGYRAWRAVHWAAYACWPLAMIHGLGTGSDARLGWSLVANVGCLAAVVAAVWWHLSIDWTSETPRRAVAAFASVVVPFGIGGFAILGPLAPGWASRAGTPQRLLGGASAPAGDASAPNAPSDPALAPANLRPPFNATLAGTLVSSDTESAGLVTITIDAVLSQGAAASLRVVLSGPAAAGGGVTLTRGLVTLGPSGDHTEYRGSVTSLAGNRLSADLADAGGHRLRVVVRLDTSGEGRVSGRVDATIPPAGSGTG